MPGSADACDRGHLSAHPQRDDDGGPVAGIGDVEPQILAAAAHSGDRLVSQTPDEVEIATDMPASRARVQNLDLPDRPADEVIREATANGLHLG